MTARVSGVTPVKARILIIDDDAFRMRAMTLLLSGKGYELSLAESAEKGLALLQRQCPDLILVDVVLPGLSGLELCRQIKSDTHWRRVPIVLLSSALLSSQAQAEGLEAGAEGYLAWPISNRELLARVALALRLSRAGEGAAPSGSKANQLTPRQREIVRLIASGLTTREAAAHLGITLRTAETHRAAAMRALDLHSTAELVRFALTSGLS